MEMGDSRRPSQRPADGIYPSSASAATPLVDEVLRPRIEADGPLSFETFMDLALYHEDHGYYSNPQRARIGAAGDFITNVSVGETFGRLLALRFFQLWKTHGNPQPFHLLELGPEDGSLALDVLRSARNLSPEFHEAIRYHACEPSPRKRAALASRFAESDEPNLTAIEPTQKSIGEFGAVFGNEVLDALPVRLVRWNGNAWKERCIAIDGDSLTWTETPIDDPLLIERTSALGEDFPAGYQTEICLKLAPTFRDLAPLLDRGLFLFIDYGFVADDYYHPDRTEGTLRTFATHQAGDDPLDSPGTRDLTAHVDFTATAAAARQAGLATFGFARQESYLTTLAQPLLRDLPTGPDSASFIRQFRTLTHPGFFGSRFHVLEFTKGSLDPEFPFPCSLNGAHLLESAKAAASP